MNNTKIIFLIVIQLLFLDCLKAANLYSDLPVLRVSSPVFNSDEIKILQKELGIEIGRAIDIDSVEKNVEKIYQSGKYQILNISLKKEVKGYELVIRGGHFKTIKDLKFELDDSAALSVLKSMKSEFIGQLFDKDSSRYLSLKIKKALIEKGYYNPEIDIQTNAITGSKDVDVLVKVQLKQGSIITGIIWEGVLKEDKVQLENLLSLKMGQVFIREELDKGIRDINHYFRVNQYPTSKVEDVQQDFSPDHAKVSIRIKLKMGGKYRFEFAGNTLFDDSELRQLLTEEILTQADAMIRISNLIEEKYKAVGFHFSKVTVKTVQENGFVKTLFLIHEGRRVIIDAIYFNGGQSFGEKKLESMMLQGAPEVLSRKLYWEKGVPEMVSRFLKKLELMGYLSSVVNGPRNLFSEDKKGVELLFDIELGIQSTVRQIELVGVNYFSHQKLLETMSFQIGETVNKEKIQAAKELLLTEYRNEGFHDAKIMEKEIKDMVLFPRTPKEALIRFTVVEGVQYFVGNISIEGNTRTQEEVIRRELKLVSKEKFNLQKYYESEESVTLLNLFSKVEFKSQLSSEDLKNKDIRILVSELRPGYGEVGLGGAYEDPRVRLKTFYGMAYKNLFGKNQTASVRAQVQVPFSPGKDKLVPFLEYSASLQYRVPFVLTLPFTFSTQLGFDAYEAAIPDPSYSILGKLVKVEEKLERKFSKKFTLIYRLHRYEHSRTEPVVLSAAAATAITIPSIIEEDVGSTGPGFIFDFRDDIFNPSKGTYHTLDFEFAHTLLLSQRKFTMLVSRNSFYFPLISPLKFTLFIGGGIASGMSSEDTLPRTRIINELALGGQNSIRGYDLKKFRAVDNAHAASYYNVRAELSSQLFSNISGAIFFDAGQIYSKGVGQGWATFPRQDGIGIGFRYKTPVGPVVFDIAESLNPRGPVKFYFMIGTL